MPFRRAASPAPSGVAFVEADRELVATLDNLDDAHNYREWILSLLRPALGSQILEVGAGHGTFTESLAVGRTVTATDLSPRCAEVLRTRFADNPDVAVVEGDLAQASVHGPFDTAVMINVLEHIEDDAGTLEHLAGQLRPGGAVALWVPAHMQLYSDFDRSIGHHRRYTTAEMGRLLTGAGFQVETNRYVNAVGAFAWWVVARTLHRTPTGKTGVLVFDRAFIPVLRRVESRRQPPFGQSILAIGRLPAAA